MKKKKRTLKDELPRSVGAHYAIEEITPERMKNRAKAKQHPVVDVMGDAIKSDAVKSNIA